MVHQTQHAWAIKPPKGQKKKAPEPPTPTQQCMVATSCQFVWEERFGTQVSLGAFWLHFRFSSTCFRLQIHNKNLCWQWEEEKEEREESDEEARQKLQQEEMIQHDDCSGGVDDITLIVLYFSFTRLPIKAVWIWIISGCTAWVCHYRPIRGFNIWGFNIWYIPRCI